MYIHRPRTVRLPRFLCLAYLVSRNYCFFDGGLSVDVKTGKVSASESKAPKERAYFLSRPISADPDLTKLIEDGIKTEEKVKMKKGLNCSGESFFSCQVCNKQSPSYCSLDIGRHTYGHMWARTCLYEEPLEDSSA